MRALTPLLLSAALLTGPCTGRLQAEIAVLYWPDTRVRREVREEVRSIVKDVAEQYGKAGPTADKGPLDFLHGDFKIRVHIWAQDRDQPSYYMWGEIFIHRDLTMDLPEFRRRLMHEFSHLYDYSVIETERKRMRDKDPVYFLRVKQGKARPILSGYVSDNDRNEARARERENRYMNGPGRLRPRPCTVHERPNACVRSGDFDIGAAEMGREREILSRMGRIALE